MNVALLLSGGTGSRLGSDIPKQYIKIKDRMLITYSLRTLVNSSHIDAIQIVAEHSWREIIISDARQYGVNTDKIVGFSDPGSSRQLSILNGLQDILCEKDITTDNRKIQRDDNVLIHDAARPLLTEKQIDDCFAALRGHDGVIPVLPVKDTMYLSKDGRAVSELINRSTIFAGQAPECFVLGKYLEANRRLLPDKILEINGSTEPAIMAGMDIVMIPGDENNFKITTQADLDKLHIYLKHGGIKTT